MSNTANRPIRVFLSHAASDRGAARKLQMEMARSGARVFTADVLSAGEAWQDRLREELAESDVFVVLLTPEALNSAFVLQEIGAAWALGKRVVVLSTDPRVPLPLDISADMVVSDFAALDSLIQKSGRIHRAGESETEPA